jgi:hypothetical protein
MIVHRTLGETETLGEFGDACGVALLNLVENLKHRSDGLDLNRVGTSVNHTSNVIMEHD